MKRFIWLLVAELLIVAVVPIIFITIHDRFSAGMVAGTIFIAIGVYIVFLGFKDLTFRRSLSFFAGLLHLFVSALPLFITRLIEYSKGFDDVQVLGLPGPAFHQLSTTIFSILILATVTDLTRAWWRQRHHPHKLN